MTVANKGAKTYGTQTGGNQPPTRERITSCCCSSEACLTPACADDIGTKAFCVTVSSLSVIQLDVAWGGPYVIAAVPIHRTAYLQIGSHGAAFFTAGVQSFQNTLDADPANQVLVSWQLHGYYYSIAYSVPPLQLYARLDVQIAWRTSTASPWQFLNPPFGQIIVDTTLAACDDVLDSSSFLYQDGFVHFSGTVGEGACSGGVFCQQRCLSGDIVPYCDWGCCNDGADWFCSPDDLPYPIFATVTTQDPGHNLGSVGTSGQIDLLKAEVNGKCFVYGGINSGPGPFGFAIACDGTVWHWCPMISPFTIPASNIYEWRQAGTISVTSCVPLVASLTFTDGVYTGGVLAITE